MLKQNVAHYIDLPGAITSNLEFEPRRWTRRDLFGATPVVCRVSGVEFDLHDASVADIAVRLNNDDQRALFKDPQGILKAQLLVDDVEMFSGAVSMTGPEAELGRKIFLRLVDSALNVNAIRSQGVKARMRDTLNRAENAAQSLVPARYAELCGRFVHLLRTLRETCIAEEPLIQNEQDHEQIVSDTEEAMYRAFEELWLEANSVTRHLSRIDPRFQAIKQFTDSLVRPELMAGPAWNRAYEKPLGYPGDFHVMEYAYEQFYKTGSLYGDAVDRLIANRFGACIRGRMAFTRDRIIDQFKKAGAGDEAFRIASIGAGSAREIDSFMAVETGRPLEITLLEQDDDALQYVYERVYRSLGQRPSGAKLKTLNASFIDLLRDGRLYNGFEEQDVIYSLGLIDYFNQPTTKRVVRGFYDRVKPGGTLVMCNMRDFEQSAFWPLEFLCDWRLEYRSEADMLDLAEGLEGAKVELSMEPTGLVWMLSITKPG